MVTDDKEGPDSVFEQQLPDADIVISQPFWPAYLTTERIGEGEEPAAGDHRGHRLGPHGSQCRQRPRHHRGRGHLLQQHQVLVLVRDFVRQHDISRDGGWNIADTVQRSYDLEGMRVGVFAAGRIGRAVIERLAPFGVHVSYTDRFRLPAAYEEKYNLTFHENIEGLVKDSDVLTVHAPLTEVTRPPER